MRPAGNKVVKSTKIKTNYSNWTKGIDSRKLFTPANTVKFGGDEQGDGTDEGSEVADAVNDGQDLNSDTQVDAEAALRDAHLARQQKNSEGRKTIALLVDTSDQVQQLSPSDSPMQFPGLSDNDGLSKKIINFKLQKIEN